MTHRTLGTFACAAERVSNLPRATALAMRCGVVAALAGLSLEDLAESLEPDGIREASVVWSTIVDAWHDARPEAT